ncbi:DUF3592 domain-containing protein [Acinetobacter pragensis]
MYLDKFIFLIGLCSLLAMWPIFALLKPNTRTQAIILILLICSYFYVYLVGLDQYRNALYQKALDAPQQEKQCAVFTQYIKFNLGRRNSHETALQFKTSASEFLEFNGDRTAFQHINQLAHLNLGQTYCFEYASEIKDWNGRFMLTKLEKTP